MFKKKRDCKINAEMGKCKTKTIQADLDICTDIPAYSSIFKHSQAYSGISGIVQSYSKPCVALVNSEFSCIQNPDIFKTRCIFRILIYPKLWHIQNQKYIQNPRLFRTLENSKPEAYLEPCQASTIEHFEK